MLREGDSPSTLSEETNTSEDLRSIYTMADEEGVMAVEEEEVAEVKMARIN